MSIFDDITPEQLGDPLDLTGGQTARRSQELAEETAVGNIEESRRQFDIGQQLLEPFAEQAIPAIQMQSALSGARGPDAQAEAFRQFEESPATQFLRESGLRLSTPGVGAGQQEELGRYAQGLALQDFGNMFNRLGDVSGTGHASQFDLTGLGENVARDIVQQQQQQFSAQQQGLAAQQAARAGQFETGLGLAIGQPWRQGGGAQSGIGGGIQGVPINQTNYGAIA